MFNLHFKQFKNIENSEGGEVNDKTIFEYFQNGNEIWGKYKGGMILEGKLEGFKTSENGFKISYSHINFKGELKTGNSNTEVSFSKEGKIILSEFWQWSDEKKIKGKSTLIEV
tara:strand:- start:154 stop:492 length:339 start_codon:yes stop_codon:yes gene_type:complete